MDPLDDGEDFVGRESARCHPCGHQSHSKDASLHQISADLVLVANLLLELHYFGKLGRQLGHDSLDETRVTLFKAVAEETQGMDQLVLFALRRVLKSLSVQGHELLKDDVACGLAERGQAYASNFHRVRSNLVDSLDVLKEVLDILLCHLALCCLELTQSFFLVKVDRLEHLRQQFEHLGDVLLRHPLLPLEVLEVLNAARKLQSEPLDSAEV